MLVNTGHCNLLRILSVNAKSPVYSYVFTHGIEHFSKFFKTTREVYENSEGILGPKRPKRSLHITLDTPWDETYYLFHPIKEEGNFSGTRNEILFPVEEPSEEDRRILDDLASIWVSFAKSAQPQLPKRISLEHEKWLKMEHSPKSLNYFLISNEPLQRGMRSDFRKAVRVNKSNHDLRL